MSEKEQYNELMRLWENDFKPIIDETHAKVDGVETLIESKVDPIFKAMQARMNERFDELETAMQRPAYPTTSTTGDDDPLLKAYEVLLRKGERDVAPEHLKTLSTGDDSAGGYLVPVVRSNEIIEYVRDYSPVRQLATIVTIDSGDAFEVPVENSTDTSGDWVAETGTRSTATTTGFGLEKIPLHEMYSKPLATQKMLTTSSFDIEGWLKRKVGDKFARVEGTAFVSGNGVGRPQGLLEQSDVGNTNSGSASTVTADAFNTLSHAMLERFIPNARWMMSRATLGVVRNLKDGQGQYLWQPAFAAGNPPMIAGFPYTTATDMPAIASSAKSVLFGDFAAAYTIVDHAQLTFLRDPFSSKPHVEFYFSKFVGGQVVQPLALRTMTISS